MVGRRILLLSLALLALPWLSAEAGPPRGPGSVTRRPIFGPRPIEG